MKFVISRTSGWSQGPDEEPPWPGATWGSYIYQDQRTWSDPSESTLRGWPEEWYNRGTNHRVVDGKITRDVVGHGWLIEVKDLQTLLDLSVESGDELVIAYRGNTPSIEIYDDYRE